MSQPAAIQSQAQVPLQATVVQPPMNSGSMAHQSQGDPFADLAAPAPASGVGVGVSQLSEAAPSTQQAMQPRPTLVQPPPADVVEPTATADADDDDEFGDFEGSAAVGPAEPAPRPEDDDDDFTDFQSTSMADQERGMGAAPAGAGYGSLDGAQSGALPPPQSQGVDGQQQAPVQETGDRLAADDLMLGWDETQKPEEETDKTKAKPAMMQSKRDPMAYDKYSVFDDLYKEDLAAQTEEWDDFAEAGEDAGAEGNDEAGRDLPNAGGPALTAADNEEDWDDFADASADVGAGDSAGVGADDGVALAQASPAEAQASPAEFGMAEEPQTEENKTFGFTKVLPPVMPKAEDFGSFGAEAAGGAAADQAGTFASRPAPQAAGDSNFGDFSGFQAPTIQSSAGPEDADDDFGDFSDFQSTSADPADKEPETGADAAQGGQSVHDQSSSAFGTIAAPAQATIAAPAQATIAAPAQATIAAPAQATIVMPPSTASDDTFGDFVDHEDTAVSAPMDMSAARALPSSSQSSSTPATVPQASISGATPAGPSAHGTRSAPAAAPDDVPSIPGLVGKLVKLCHFEMALQCQRHERTKAELKRLGALMAKAAADDDFEGAIRLGDELKKLKSSSRVTQEDVEAWEKLVAQDVQDARIYVWQNTPEDLKRCHPDVHEKFEQQFGSLSQIYAHAATDLDAAAGMYAEGARCLVLLVATRIQSHVVSAWTDILDAVAKEFESGIETLSVGTRFLDATALPTKVRVYLQGLQRMLVVGRLVGAAAQEAFLFDEMQEGISAVEEKWMAIRSLGTTFGVRDLGAVPTIDEIRREVRAHTRNAETIGLCSLTLQPLSLGRVGKVVTYDGGHYFAPAVNLYRHRVSQELPAAGP
eukprot:scaffold31_cov263-Pinguiococcus_pyrenoidosus.AAC.36